MMLKGQCVSLVWQLAASSDVDRPLSCTFHVNYYPLNDDDASDVYEYKHSFVLNSCKVSYQSLFVICLSLLKWHWHHLQIFIHISQCEIKCVVIFCQCGQLMMRLSKFIHIEPLTVNL